jgi:hypothetical protein
VISKYCGGLSLLHAWHIWLVSTVPSYSVCYITEVTVLVSGVQSHELWTVLCLLK